MTKIFISGLGNISSLGNSPDILFENLEKDRRFFKYYPEWKKFKGLKALVGAPCFPYDISKALHRKMRRSMSPMSEMAYLATLQALDQAGICLGENKPNSHPFKADPHRTLLVIGNTAGSPLFLDSFFRQMIEKEGPEGQLSTSFLKVMNHTIPTNISLALGFSGPLLSPSSACSTSSQAIILASELMKSGLYDMAVVGGADELHPHVVSIFDIVQATSSNYNETPEDIPGPFDQKRDGIVVSEGAGIVILETEKHLNKRKGTPLAEFSSGIYRCSGNHMTQPKASDMADTMAKALELANISPSDIDYINAHGTGTHKGDHEESDAISQTFKGENTSVSSLKGHFGHSLAACGAIEVISIIQMMKKNKIIGTRNLKNPPKNSGDINYLKDQEVKSIDYALSNNFAFGGMNTSMVIKGV